MRWPALVLVLVAARGLAAQQGRPCLVQLLGAERQGHGSQPLPGNTNNTNYDVAGNVRLQCRGQPVFMNADSVNVISGDFFRFITRADYRDPSYRVDADTIYYIRRIEKIEARGHVRVLDRITGSTMDAPYVDYFRAVKGINDSASVLAMQRASVRYFKRTIPGDTAHATPYLLVGDVLHGFGESRLRANGSVSVDRDSLHGTGDSLWFDRGATGIGRLMGAHAVLRRSGPDSFEVHGREIRVAFDGDRIRELRAYDSARVTRSGSRVTGDTIQLKFDDQKLVLTLAWNRKTGATLHDAGYDMTADSLAVDSPGEMLHEIRAFVHGRMVSPRDSSAMAVRSVTVTPDSLAPDTTHNTLWGNHLVARFTQADSAGHAVTRLDHLEAAGAARSYFSRMVARNGKVSPSINYTRADTIFVFMRPGDSVSVASVQAYGHVDGVQMETASMRKSRKDSTGTAPAGGKP